MPGKTNGIYIISVTDIKNIKSREKTKTYRLITWTQKPLLSDKKENKLLDEIKRAMICFGVHFRAVLSKSTTSPVRQYLPSSVRWRQSQGDDDDLEHMVSSTPRVGRSHRQRHTVNSLAETDGQRIPGSTE